MCFISSYISSDKPIHIWLCQFAAVTTVHKMKLLLVLAALLGHVLGSRLPYIVGGNEVTEVGKWPWQVSLQSIVSGHFCGASILSDKWILTAAHCVGGVVSSVTVVVGMHDRRKKQVRRKTPDAIGKDLYDSLFFQKNEALFLC